MLILAAILLNVGAWTKDAKEKYDCYKKIVDEYNANQELIIQLLIYFCPEDILKMRFITY